MHEDSDHREALDRQLAFLLNEYERLPYSRWSLLLKCLLVIVPKTLGVQRS